jgi:hypothetical protein
MASNEDIQIDSVRGITHGWLCYLQIPALDAMSSAAFSEKIFGWKIERPFPSFEAPGLIGQWVTDRQPAPARYFGSTPGACASRRCG